MSAIIHPALREQDASEERVETRLAGDYTGKKIYDKKINDMRIAEKRLIRKINESKQSKFLLN